METPSRQTSINILIVIAIIFTITSIFSITLQENNSKKLAINTITVTPKEDAAEADNQVVDMPMPIAENMATAIASSSALHNTGTITASSTVTLSTSTTSESSDSQLSLTSNEWVWKRIEKPTFTATTTPKTVGDYSVTFDKNGAITVKTDCNTFKGIYSIKKNEITFKNITPVTKKVCKDSKETTFIDFFKKPSKYSFSDSKLLILKSEEQKLKAVFKK